MMYGTLCRIHVCKEPFPVAELCEGSIAHIWFRSIMQLAEGDVESAQMLAGSQEETKSGR